MPAIVCDGNPGFNHCGNLGFAYLFLVCSWSAFTNFRAIRSVRSAWDAFRSEEGFVEVF